MGIYINPPSLESKEQFLELYGERITPAEVRNFDLAGDYFPVCLVDNGPFTAAGVIFNKTEVDAFLYEKDMRPKKFYKVKKLYLADENLSGIPASCFLQNE